MEPVHITERGIRRSLGSDDRRAKEEASGRSVFPSVENFTLCGASRLGTCNKECAGKIAEGWARCAPTARALDLHRSGRERAAAPDRRLCRAPILPLQPAAVVDHRTDQREGGGDVEPEAAFGFGFIGADVWPEQAW